MYSTYVNCKGVCVFWDNNRISSLSPLASGGPRWYSRQTDHERQVPKRWQRLQRRGLAPQLRPQLRLAYVGR